jgi:PBP1b-binding outer membrane lipoprotein LpoB
MKKLIMVFSILFIFSACKEKPVNPVKEYGDFMINTIETSKKTSAQTSLEDAKRAINEYYIINNRYPESIEEVAKLMDSKFKPEAYEYDPASGKLSVKR